MLVLATMFAVASGVVVAGPVHQARAEDYPGQAEIDEARAAANDLAAGIDELDNAIAALADARDKAEANALVAGEDYVQAQEASDAAADTLDAANERAAEAEKELAEARENLASVAQAAYRDAGSMSQIGAVVGAETVDDVIARTEAFSRGSDEADMWVQRVKAAELVATTMRSYADEAATSAAEAAEEAKSSYAEAQDAQQHAEEAVAMAAETRSDAVNRLAELRGVTVALEEQRQAGLEAERAAAEQAEAEARQQAAEEAAASETPRPRPTKTSTPGSTSTSTPKPTATKTSTPKPTATKTSEPEPTTTTSTPKPTTTSTPKPETPGTTWNSTAAQGVKAAQHSLTLVGREYLLGGSGPKYDCSGVTSESWSVAGQWITRSSRSQYLATTHLAYSQIREGDLVFYATDTSDPSTIFHVAIYIGNGQVMEAVNYSKPAGVRSLYGWMAGNMMPFIGRP